ncbi:MAG: type II toxin-antitoxin system PemK/MazF family toxin [Candidatus Gracilibacteria bacterium]|nr:type II toxin-antitoxin system PemK/MazF family toxin [Candidatus Gracilibacteria bacterium]
MRIYFCDLGKNIGSELNKKRPCIILSKKFINNGNTVLIAPLKSFKGKINKNYQIKFNCNKLKNISIIDFSGIRQISKKN